MAIRGEVLNSDTLESRQMIGGHGFNGRSNVNTTKYDRSNIMSVEKAGFEGHAKTLTKPKPE